MNIFTTFDSPTESAQFLDDKRATKMCLETAQILCTVINEANGKQVTPYRSTHKHHPCTLWAGVNIGNFMWLVEHGLRLCERYEDNYNRQHKCKDVILKVATGAQILPHGRRTNFINCAANKSLNLDYSRISDTHLAYRMYLRQRWLTDKQEPTWNRETMIQQVTREA